MNDTINPTLKAKPIMAAFSDRIALERLHYFPLGVYGGEEIAEALGIPRKLLLPIIRRAQQARHEAESYPVVIIERTPRGADPWTVFVTTDDSEAEQPSTEWSIVHLNNGEHVCATLAGWTGDGRAWEDALEAVQAEHRYQPAYPYLDVIERGPEALPIRLRVTRPWMTKEP